MQFLVGDVGHNSSSVMLFVDRWGRLMFNAGEGVQRLIRGNRVRTKQVSMEEIDQGSNSVVCILHSVVSLV
jgi:hypothetical protein